MRRGVIGVLYVAYLSLEVGDMGKCSEDTTQHLIVLAQPLGRLGFQEQNGMHSP